MKPLAKLTVVRQRLYKKSCDGVEGEDFEEHSFTDGEGEGIY